MNGKASSPDQLNDREKEVLTCLATGLSDQQIADQLFLSLNTVKWYNRQIYSKLGVRSRTQALAYAQHLGYFGDSASKRRPPVPQSNLPAQATSFVGRSSEIIQVMQLLSRCRLLTLTGAGGIGKTRLALQVAAEVAKLFPDGTYFVDLAPLSDPMLVPKALARSLGLFESATTSVPNILKQVLAEQRVLLLIDNFEHLIEAAQLLSELLAATLHLKLLITSREPLRLAGEQEYPVPPLSLPVVDAVSAQTLAQSEAGLLFVQRVQLTRPRFEVSDDNALAIAQICARLDGLPLAIELAAARCKLLTPKALLARLQRAHDGSPLHALASGARDAPPRQRTLRDTMAWSYALLSDDEKKLFARLAVFRGGCSLDALEAMCGHDVSLDVLDGLASLVDKSLVQQRETAEGEPRFTLLEMIHEYAREQLEAGGEAETMRRRHALYFVALAERAEPDLRLARYDAWCRRFEIELDNLRAVLGWALHGGDVTLGVRLASALGLFWYGKGHHVEGIHWTQQLLNRLDETPVVYHAKFLFGAGHMTWMHDLDTAQGLFRKALEIARDLGDPLQTAWALIFLGYSMMHTPQAAMPVAEEGLAIFRKRNDLPGVAQALNIIGEVARLAGDDRRAREAYEDCLAVSQHTQETRRIGYMFVNLAYIALHENDHARAMSLGRQALRLAQERQDRRDVASAAEILAGAIGVSGQLRRAVPLLGAVDAEYARTGAFRQPSDTPEIDRIIATLRAQLSDAAFQAAWAEGQHMTMNQVIANILADNSLADQV
jgi:predicted ATPase/DNA-binding CsgD family transcriptional regulator